MTRTFTYRLTKPAKRLSSNVTHQGEYKVAITYNGCTISSSTQVDISECDNLYIKSTRLPSGTESNKLVRKPTAINKNEYEDMQLQVQTFDGQVLKSLQYTWVNPPGTSITTDPNANYRALINNIGQYKVQASSASGTNCVLSVDIVGEKCDPVPNTFVCEGAGYSPIKPSTDQNLTGLASGDEFTSKDYTIIVTSATGNQTAGWTGTGKLVFNLLQITGLPIIQIPVSVTFTNAYINQCYQLYSGKVVTAYDAGWSSVKSIGSIQDELASIKQQIIDLLSVGKPLNDPQVSELSTRLGEIKATDLLNWDADTKLAVGNGISTIQNALSCTASIANARTNVTCDAETALSILTGVDLEGYVVVKELKGVHWPNDFPRPCNFKNIQYCYNDNISLTDNRLDLFGFKNLVACFNKGEGGNFTTYKGFLNLFGVGFMADHLKNGNGTSIDLTNQGNIVTNIVTSNDFKDFQKEFTDITKAAIISNNINNLNFSVNKSPKFNIFYYIFPTQAYAAIGGTQFYNLDFVLYRKKGNAVILTDPKNYKIDFNWEFKDVYGSDFNDINIGVKGLVPALNSLFTLQHSFIGYRPYITKVLIKKSMSFQ